MMNKSIQKEEESEKLKRQPINREVNKNIKAKNTIKVEEIKIGQWKANQTEESTS